ncbi:MAG: MotA/TolQ/ExbB proton channel family protein, partial [Planctomycetaceae bacterium]
AGRPERARTPGRPAWTVWLWLTLVALTAARPTPAAAWQSAPADVALEEGEPGGDDLREPQQGRPSATAPSLPSLADQIGSIPTRLSEMFVAGGFIMWPLALCSVVAFTFAVERMVVLRRRRVIPGDFVRRFLGQLEQQQLDRASAIELCEANSSPISQVFLHGVRKWGKPSVEVEQAILDGGERQVGHLRRHLRILNAVATIAPLLGLLGTVIGMIMCFNQIATSSAMGKSEQLAGGIGVALLTTAFGLAIAIPALMVYMYFAGRIDALVMEMDTLSQRVVDQISAEALAGRGGVTPWGGPPRPKALPPLGSAKSAP